MRIRMRILVTTAVQAAFLKAAANITVQVATAWKSGAGRSAAMDWGRVVEFSVYGFISAGLGFPWQHLLEDHFPTQATTSATPSLAAAARARRPTLDGGGVSGPQQLHDGHHPDDPEKRRASLALDVLPATPGAGTTTTSHAGAGISWRNVLYKLVLDQTVWLLFTTSIFLVITNFLRVPSAVVLFQVWKEKTWFIIKAAWHVWPLVAILNFAFVPVDLRVLVAACVGFAWNIFLSLISLTNT